MSDKPPLPGFLDAYLSQQAEPFEAAVEAPLRPGEWRGLWTWMERVDGEILPASLEILGRARELADELGTRSAAVLFGHGVAKDAATLGTYGADRILVVDHADFAEFTLKRAREALLALVREHRPEVVLFPATVQGRNLGAQLSAALATGIIPNCNELSLDATERLLVGHQTSFEGRLLSEIVCPDERPQLFTITPGSFRRPAADPTRRAPVQVVEPSLPASPPKVRFLAREEDPQRPLDHADAIVAAGLGVASKEGFLLAEELAEELQAYAGATRGAVACGWAEPERLISRARNHHLRPRLYVACGVVGEYDHVRAIEEASLVVALTDDANLPIVETADLVGVGPPEELLRRLVDALRAAKRDRVTIPSTPSRT